MGRERILAPVQQDTSPDRDAIDLDGTSPAAASQEPSTLRRLQGRIDELTSLSDGTALDDGVASPIDRLEAFGPAVLAVRWGTVVASVALVASSEQETTTLQVVWAVVAIAYTVLRTARPLRYRGDVRSLVGVLAEVVLDIVILGTTGWWESPFIFLTLSVITVAGFARGFGFSLRVATAVALAVSLPYIIEDPAQARIRVSAQWTLISLFASLIAGYARRISGEADRQHSLALDRLGRLADANSLLFSLHRLTQTLPASLDLDEVLDSTVTRLRSLFAFDFAAVLLADDTDDQVWHVVRREGARMPQRMNADELPRPLRAALATGDVVEVPSLADRTTTGMALKAASGMYAALPARGSLIGLIAVEHKDERHLTARDQELMRGFVEPVALAIDNARWFSRLRTVGADEERTRIARDLHDRIGQSLAYLAFELDRIVSAAERDEAVLSSLEQLREDVRGVIREVRDTLYDLRTDVSDTQDLSTVLESFAARVRERSQLEVDLACDSGHRLPLLQEREMWRIAQEAVTNVERHAGASKVQVVWRCDGSSAVLEVADDGDGFPIGQAGRFDSYGILGMRERASSIGASFAITSDRGSGTRVRATLLADADHAGRPLL
jgi:signal transduction histidine kinase